MKKASTRTLSLLLVMIFLFACVNFSSFASDDSGKDKPRTSVELPKVYINTANGKNPGEKDNVNYLDGGMRIELNEKYADCKNAYTGENMLGIGIRTRGNSTRTFMGVKLSGKYAYKIKLDEKADMFGMGESKEWLLISNVFDPTHMRNMTGQSLASLMGLPHCDSTWVSLYLNGEYRGLYQFFESVEIGSDRLDITDWDEIIEDIAESIGRKNNYSESRIETIEEQMSSDMSWITSGQFAQFKISDYYNGELDITSGYLIELDSFDSAADTRPYLFKSETTPEGVRLKIDSPKNAHTNKEMLSYVRTLILDFEEAINSSDFCTSDGRHYSEICDMDSLVDFWILQNIVKNREMGIRSMFFYIEDGKMYWGPVWDFDCGAGNHLTVETSYEKWVGTQEDRNYWYKALYNDTYFVTCLQNRYAELRSTLDIMISQIEANRDYIESEAEKDYEKYGSRIFNDSSNSSKTFSEEFDFYVQWQKNRIAWLDDTLLSNNPIEASLTYSEKIILKTTYTDGTAVEGDRLIQYGAKSTYLFDTSKKMNLRIKVSTTHTTSTTAYIYINGKFYAQKHLTEDNPFEIEISRSKLDTTDGARNNVHFVIYNKYGNVYRRYGFTILSSSVQNPTNTQAVVQIGNNVKVVEKNSVFTLPEALEDTKSFYFAGWTDGENVYPAGSKITVTEGIYLYEKWSLAPVAESGTNNGNTTGSIMDVEENGDYGKNVLKYNAVIIAVASGLIILCIIAVTLVCINKKRREV